MLVHHKLPKYRHIWPIDPNAVKPPEGWTGWPEGKKFALVLTHDVETIKGVEKCPQLMEIEEKLGFRSSFGFVAGDYEVPQQLLKSIDERGFETYIHGLHHNKNPFRSKKVFSKQLVEINHYLKKWNVVGFRTPSMYHDLDLIHKLNIDYDASTFDTDPFEPQPDGVHTIFPFWVGDSNRQSGYVELPYTLPQDFLLYILMQENNTDIWKKKIDWIAKNGGMVLFITHPDYMNFGNTTLTNQEYPTRYYEEFLDYIKTKYTDQYWHVLPRDIAHFWSAHYANKTKKDKKLRVCMLAYTFYELDGRVRKYAEALAQRGDHVDIIALQREDQPPHEILNGVSVFRIQERKIDEKGKLDYLYRSLKFFIKSSIFLAQKNKGAPYDLIHVHSLPDFEVFATWLPKLSGSKIILDIHDIVPEFYASKFNVDSQSIIFNILKHIEKASTKFAHHVIAANHIWEKTLTDRSVEKEKCTTFLNYPDTSIFHKISSRKEDGKFTILYPGTLNKHQGLDIAIKAFSLIKDDVPKANFHIYGEGPDKPFLKELVASLGLQERISFKGLIPIDKIAHVMANADLGIVPKRNNFFGGEAFSTKILEFMISGIAVIVSETKIDKYYFNDSIVKFFKPDDVNDLAQCMLTMINDETLRKQLIGNALQFVEDFKWDTKKAVYLNLVDSLVGNINTSRIHK
jgi:glycosyltransferase involved in cell wall biosynthesis